VDERLMKKCIGKPVPEWDMAHQLPIDQPVGPEIQETGTVFRINSIYMDVTEPAFLEKQWFITASVLALAFIGVGPFIYAYTHADDAPDSWLLVADLFALFFVAFFGFFFL